MKKSFYSEYLDEYLNYCTILINNNSLKKEDIPLKIGLPPQALYDLYNNRYALKLTKSQVVKLFAETEKLSFFFNYNEKERNDIIESYKILIEKKNDLNKENKSLNEREFLMFKKYKDILQRAGIIQNKRKNQQMKMKNN